MEFSNLKHQSERLYSICLRKIQKESILNLSHAYNICICLSNIVRFTEWSNLRLSVKYSISTRKAEIKFLNNLIYLCLFCFQIRSTYLASNILTILGENQAVIPTADLRLTDAKITAATQQVNITQYFFLHWIVLFYRELPGVYLYVQIRSNI